VFCHDAAQRPFCDDFNAAIHAQSLFHVAAKLYPKCWIVPALRLLIRKFDDNSKILPLSTFAIMVADAFHSRPHCRCPAAS
jgi:hypothetical protein